MSKSSETDCGVRHETNTSFIPCMLERGHEGGHWSTSGCAGGEVRWSDTLTDFPYADNPDCREEWRP